MRDRTFLGRLLLCTFAVTLAAAGGSIVPLGFVALVATGILGQLVLEALTARPGAASIWVPPVRTVAADATHLAIRGDPLPGPGGK
jgi:hypothetical protein